MTIQRLVGMKIITAFVYTIYGVNLLVVGVIVDGGDQAITGIIKVKMGPVNGLGWRIVIGVWIGNRGTIRCVGVAVLTPVR